MYGGGDGRSAISAGCCPAYRCLSRGALEVVQTLVLELHPQRQGLASASLDSSLERELGFDSLGRVELLQRVERAFGVQLPDQVLATAETPRDLLRALTTAGAHSRIIDASRQDHYPLRGRCRPLPAGTLVDVLEWHVRCTRPPASLLLRRSDTG